MTPMNSLLASLCPALPTAVCSVTSQARQPQPWVVSAAKETQPEAWTPVFLSHLCCCVRSGLPAPALRWLLLPLPGGAPDAQQSSHTSCPAGWTGEGAFGMEGIDTNLCYHVSRGPSCLERVKFSLCERMEKLMSKGMPASKKG